MSLDESNACDMCDRPLHPNVGAICPKCVHEMEGWA